jgi:hypothetical protein
MSTLASHRVPEAVEPSGRDLSLLPTLFGEGQGLYRIQRSTFLLSFLLHVPVPQPHSKVASHVTPQQTLKKLNAELGRRLAR